MPDTSTTSASTAATTHTPQAAPAAPTATKNGYDPDSRYHLTVKGWCESMGMSSAAQEAIHATTVGLEEAAH